MVKLVGILNITPDSFSDGGKYNSPCVAIARAEQLFSDGADFIDVGAESTRPNATPLSDDEEWARLEPILKYLLDAYPGKISLDSYHPATIKRAFEIGDIIVNDVTGMQHPEMQKIVLDHNARCIISHLPKGSIVDAHKTTPISSVVQVKSDLLAQAKSLEARGLAHDRIILDPGIGFGKASAMLNQKLLCFAQEISDYPVMIGYSRKRFLGESRMELAPNIKAAKTAIKAGAVYLRVHDVAAHKAALSAQAAA